MKLNRESFWNLYHKYFDAYGATTQKTVDALNAILDRFETETRLQNIAQFAYVLATAFHESGIKGNHFVPVKEGRERAGAKGRKNQDRYWLSGYYGRGLIQTTWEEKYLAVGNLLGVGDMFVKNPDLLLEIGWAYEALVAGMVYGIYRKDEKGKHTLKRHLKRDDESTAAYIEAREIVNGDKRKNGALIANYAQHFETILTRSKDSAAVPAPEPAKDIPSDARDAQSSDSPADVEKREIPTENQTEPSPGNSPAVETTQTQKLESEGATVEESETVKNEQDVNVPGEVAEPEPQGFKAKLGAGIAALFGGTLVYDAAGKLSGIQFSMQTIYIICFVIFLAFLGFCLWAILDTVKKNKRVEIEAMANTAIDRKNIKWVKPERTKILGIF